MMSTTYRELLLGCGSKRDKRIRPYGHEEWSELTTLDFEARHQPDVLWDLEQIKPLPFENDQFDEIHAYEVIEHLGLQGDFRSLFYQFEDYWRILKPGGLFCATCPAWNGKWAWGDPGHKRVINDGTLIFLCQPEYTKQVGRTPMSDYRTWYSGDFDLAQAKYTGETFSFVLQAVKPSRKEAA